jgi:hypothetical protein
MCAVCCVFFLYGVIFLLLFCADVFDVFAFCVVFLVYFGLRVGVLVFVSLVLVSLLRCWSFARLAFSVGLGFVLVCCRFVFVLCVFALGLGGLCFASLVVRLFV